MLQEALYDQAVALGLVDEDVGAKRAAAGDRSEPVDLAEYRRAKGTVPHPRGGK
jgi:hypothetical protein